MGEPDPERPSQVLATRTRLPLYCLAGAVAPPALASDLLKLLTLPPEAATRFWQVLAPCLAEPVTRAAEEHLDLFCAAYGIPEDDLARAVKATRFLVREAVSRDVPSAAVGADLDALCPGAWQVREIVLGGYDEARTILRRDMLHAAIAEHGQLLVKVGWRRDQMLATERGKIDAPLGVLTLHLREGAETQRLTVFALPDVVRALRAACDGLLGA
jgi:hypothetical protein